MTAKADPPQFEDQSNSDASTAIAILSTMAMETAIDLPIVSLPTHPLASSTSIAFKEVPESNPNPLMNLPASITNPTKNGTFESSFGLPTALPKNSHHVEADAVVGSLLIPPSSQNDSEADDVIKTTTLPESPSDPKIQAAASDDGPGVSMAPPPSSMDAAHPVATTSVTQTSQVASKADTLPFLLSGPSSSVLVGANCPQSKPLNSSSRAGFRSRTALGLEVGGGVLTAGSRAQGSGVSNMVFGGGTVRPFRNEGGRSGGVFSEGCGWSLRLLGLLVAWEMFVGGVDVGLGFDFWKRSLSCDLNKTFVNEVLCHSGYYLTIGAASFIKTLNSKFEKGMHNSLAIFLLIPHDAPHRHAKA